MSKGKFSTRLLSFLLVLCMLITMIPIMATVTAAVEEGPQEEDKNKKTDVASFYDLYIKEGLVALFDAFDETTVDLDNGKWFAKVMKDGALTKSEDVFATIAGGKYVETEKETGWKYDTATGLSYSDKGFTASANKLSLDKTLFGDVFTLEVVDKLTLRSIPRETKTFTVGVDTSNITSAAGEGNTVYTITSTQSWNAAVSTNYTLTFKGTAEAEVDVIVKTAEDGEPIASPKVTLDIDGNGTFSGKAAAPSGNNKQKLYVTVPDGAELVDATLDVHSSANEAGVPAAFTVGYLWGMTWSNLLGSNTWGNGFGTTRWYAGSASWAVHNGSSENAAFICSFGDDYTSFPDNDGKIVNTTFVRTGSKEKGHNYSITIGGKAFLESANGGIVAEKTIDDVAFDLFCNLPVEVYSIRVYNKEISAAAVKWNHAADMLIHSGADLAKYNALRDIAKAAAVEELAKLDLTATKETVEGVLDAAEEALKKQEEEEQKQKEQEALARALTAYDALYVGADGEATANGGKLLGLFSAYAASDPSVFKGTGSGTWYNKIEGGKDITLTGEFKQDAIGITGAVVQPDKSLLPAKNYTIDYFVKYNSDSASTSASTIVIGYWRDSLAAYSKNYNFNVRWIMADVTGDTAWNVESSWATGQANAGHTIFDGWGDYGYTQANGCRVTGTPYSQTFTREMADDFSSSKTVVLDNMATKVSTTRTATGKESKAMLLKGRTLYGTKTLADKTTEPAPMTITHSEDELPFYFFKYSDTTVYSFRVYDAVLTTEELTQNHFADLLAYAGADAEAYAKLSPEMKLIVNDTLATIEITDPATMKTKIDDTIANAEKIVERQKAAREMTTYDQLYVGADGSETANGGHLTGLFTAYLYEDPSVMFDDKTWVNKIEGQPNFTIAGGTEETDIFSGWHYYDDGGFGYDISAVDAKIGLMGPISLLPKNNYSVEMVSIVRGWTVDHAGKELPDNTAQYGACSCDMPSFDFGPFHGWLYTGHGVAGNGSWTDNKVYNMYYQTSTTWAAVGAAAGWGHSPAINVWASKLTTVVFSTLSLVKTGTTAAYSMADCGTNVWSRSFTAVANNDSQAFNLFRSAGGTVYAVRVYDADLTKAEINYNHFIDLAAYAGADLSSFVTLSAETKTLLTGLFAGTPFLNNEEFGATMEELTGLLSAENVDKSELFYVQNGLQAVFTFFPGFNSGSYDSGNGVMWFNAINRSESATLSGAGWKRGENGGYRIDKTNAEWQANHDFGITLPYDMVPENNYTVEFVFNPLGITDVNDDGSRTRFMDTTTTYGTYDDYGIVVGPLRCLQWSCYRPAGRDGQMERRWIYLKSGGWGEAKYVSKFTDTSWKSLDPDQIVTYAITLDLTSDGASYRFFNDLKSVGSIVIGSGAVIGKHDVADNMFQIMHHMPGTVYAVRIYDRVLTDAEQLQNHVADLIYYYDLDVSVFENAVKNMDDTTTVYKAFKDMDFTLTKEEAQELFNNRIGALWLSYNGVAIRNDMTDGMRFYYDLNMAGINALLVKGYLFEIGAVINVGKDAKPTLDGDDYDYKVVAFTSAAGNNEGLFIDEDTFAVTVLYENATKEEYLKMVNVLGFVKVQAPDSDEAMIFYIAPEEERYTPDTLFSAYAHKVSSFENNDELSDLLTYVNDVVGDCYTNEYVYVDAAAVSGGDGSKETPYKDFPTALARCKELTRSIVTPTNLYMALEDGEYGIYEEQTIDGADIAYEFCNFALYALDGDARLTTTRPIDAEGFEEFDENIYVYQVPALADGSYPVFRYLYVDGEMAELAHNGALHAYTDEMLSTVGERDYDGLYELVKQLHDTDSLRDAECPYPAERTDLIAVYNNLRDKYLALEDIAALDASTGHELNLSYAPADTASDAYKAAYKDFLYRFTAINEINAMIKNSQLNSGATSQYTDNGDYTAIFNAYKADALSGTVLRTSSITVTYTSTSQSDNRVYLQDALVGNLKDRTAELLEGLPTAEETFEKAKTRVKEADAYIADAISKTSRFLNDINALKLDLNGKAKAKDATEEVKQAAKDVQKLLDAVTLVSGGLQGIVTLEKNVKSAQDALNSRSLSPAITNAESAVDYQIQAAGYFGKNGDYYAEYQRLYKIANGEDGQILFDEGDVFATLKADTDELLEKLASLDKLVGYCNVLAGFNIDASMAAQWDFNIIHIRGVDFDDKVSAKDIDGKTVTLYAAYMDPAEYKSYQIPGGYKFSGRYIYVENAREFLDSENEYFYDVTDGKLYYYTEDDITEKTFAYPTMDNMLNLNNIKQFGMYYLTFTGVDDAFLTLNGHCGGQAAGDGRFGGFPTRSAVYVTNCYGMTVDSCIFTDLGVDGMTCRGRVENLDVVSCEFINIGATGLRLGGSTSAWDEKNGCDNVNVEDNYFQSLALVYHQAPAFQAPSCYKTTIVHNTILDCGYSAMSIGWRWNEANWQKGEAVNLLEVEIAYNYITDFMTELADGGAIYMLGGNAANDVTEYFNYLHDNYLLFSDICGDGKGGMICGIYHDGSSSNFHDYNNVVVEHSSREDGRSGSKLVKRRNGSTYIYIQHIDSQLTHNVLCENNIILNVRNSPQEPTKQLQEVYKTYVVASRNIKEQGTRYYQMNGSTVVVPTVAEDIILAAGCSSMMGDPEIIRDNNY